MNIEQAYQSDPEMVAEFIQGLYDEAKYVFDTIQKFLSGDNYFTSQQFLNRIRNRVNRDNREFREKYDSVQELFSTYAYFSELLGYVEGQSDDEIDRSIRERLELDADADDDEVMEASEAKGEDFEYFDDLWFNEVAISLYDTFSSYGEVQDNIKNVAEDLGITLEA